jgi:uncharacterized cupredoxin-like copper-binding protein
MIHMSCMIRPLAAATILAAMACACGGSGGGSSSSKSQSGMPMDGPTSSTGAPAAAAGPRSVDITMIDLAYQPAALTVHRGDRVEFVFHNMGKIPHDAFIGDTAAQSNHEQEMRAASKGGHMSSDPHEITVDPGQTGRLTYTFDDPAILEIGCHQPGHYAAGMRMTVTVA